MNKFDVIIIGTGAAGLYCALHLDPTLRVLLITKTELRECNSYLAQGGITTVLDDDDKISFLNDTRMAGRNEGDIHAINLLADRAEDVISKLLTFQMPFTMKNGQLCYTKEGGHSENRILYAKDETGKHLVETLVDELNERSNITLWEQTLLIDILEDPTSKSCIGVMVEKDGEQFDLLCNKTVLACGGIGGLFKNSTNQKTVSGDAIAIAHKHDIVMKNLSYIQFHPTALYEASSNSRRFLISESVRGEGAYLLNLDKERFVNELLPRDIVAAAIWEEQRKYNKIPSVFLDISHVDSAYLITRFPYIYNKCLAAGYDLAKESIPVTPSQHYHMGGIQVDLHGSTSMDNLYAIGEVSCTGVHGANRLASNSLLEALVYGEACAKDINQNISSCSSNDKTYVFYPELKDSKYRAKLVQSILTDENGGICNELCDCG